MHHKIGYLPSVRGIAINGLLLVNSGAPMSTVPIINPDAIQALRELSPDGDGAFLQELIAIYLTDTPKQLALLEEALARQDAIVVTRAAHTIKGSSGNFGADDFATLARQIETEGKANNLAAAAALVPEFKRRFDQVAAALKELVAT
jgi:HPt (histidine-containing phosphotransfer) domain-containing protein